MPKLFGFQPLAMPGPRPVPFVGVPYKLFQFLDDPIAVMFRLRPYGDVVGVIADSPALVAVFGAERTKEVLTNPSVFQHDETVFTGPPGSQLDKLRYAIIAVNADVHRRHRQLMMPAFQRSALEGYAEDIAVVTASILDRWRVNEEVRVDTLMRELTLSVAVRCFYGLDVLAGATELGHLASDLVETLTSPLTILTPFNLPGMPYRKAVNLADALLGRLAELVAEKRAQGPGARDALSMLVHDSDREGARLTDDELVAEATTLFIAGHETIAMTLSWTLFILERHPKELDRLLDEIESVLGDRTPVPADAARMPVLDRVIKESMRIVPPVPLLFMRACSKEAGVGSYRLPPKANVLVSPLMAHRDERVFPEPRRFKPDRWIDFTPPAYTYLPYGGGPRVCIGAAFANQALRIMLPMILRRYRFTLRSGADVSRLTRANIMHFKHGLWMGVEPQHRRDRPIGPCTGDVVDLVDFG